MALLLALVIALIPLAIAPGLLFYFDVTPKTVLLLMGTAAAMVWWAASPRTGLSASRQARWFVLALAGMALSLVVSTLASVNPALSFTGSNWRYWGLLAQFAALALAYLVAVCCAGRPERLRLILVAIAASGFVAAIYGIAQYFGWDPLLDPRGYHAGVGVFTIVRPPSTLGHADYFADWMLCVVFAAVALAGGTTWRWLGVLSGAAGCVSIVLSGTRGAMLGLLTGAAFLIFWRGLRITRRTVAAALATAVAAVVFYFSPPGARLRARVHWSRDEPAGGARLLLWRDSLRMAAQRWPAGYGPETFVPAFALHQSADLSRAYPDFYHESPHNIFLDALASQGMAGPLLLAALCAAGFAAAWSARPNPAAAALAAGLAAMTVGGQFASFTMPTALACYVTVALLVSLACRESPPEAGERARPWLAAAAVLGAGVLAVFGVRLFVAERALAAAQHDMATAQLADAATHYASYESWRWPGPSADLWYSQRLLQIAAASPALAVRAQAYQEAGLAAVRATRTTEAAFNAYYNLAAFYARQNNFAATEQSLRAAIACAPNWFKSHWMLAQVLEAAARLKEAETEAATAATLDGGKHPQVTGTLTHIRAALAAASLRTLQ